MDTIMKPTSAEISEIIELESSTDHNQQCNEDDDHDALPTVEAEEQVCVALDVHQKVLPSNDVRTNHAGNVDQDKLKPFWMNFSSFYQFCDLFFNLSSHSSRTRLYQVWPGKNVFFFRGHIVCGPDPRGLVLTATSIFLSDWIFCAYVIDIPKQSSYVVATLSMLLTAIVMISLFLASTKDPGIVPRNKQSSDEVGTRLNAQSRMINVDGVVMKLKYCKICNIYRPLRSCHCIVCDNCVERFDHHCPWLSQCIGLRNYRYYLMFISSAMVFFIYVFIFSWMKIRQKLSEMNNDLFGILGTAPETLLLTLFSFVAIWFLGGLNVFHVYLITVNQTSCENFKQRYAKRPNPYDKGVTQNVKQALFTRLPPSKIDFREVIEPNWTNIARMLINSTKFVVNQQGTVSMPPYRATVKKYQSI